MIEIDFVSECMDDFEAQISWDTALKIFMKMLLSMP
jgi:hypothetical protein